MADVVLIADQRHEAFNCDGKAYQIIDAGQTFSTSEGRALRLVESGVAHYDLAADEDVAPVATEAPKVDGRTKAGRANKGR